MSSIDQLLHTSQPMPLAVQVGLNILVTEQLLTQAFTELLKPFDVTPEQYNVLRILRGQKGKPASLGCIQERMIARNSNTTRILDKLVAKNLATRCVCPNNRRMIEVLITDQGLQLLSQLDPLADQHNERFAAHLSAAELEQLNILLEKYRQL